MTAARSAAAAALAVVVAFHRAEQPLMTQVGYGIGDISTAEKRQLAAGSGLHPPDWPDSPSGRVAAAAWHGRCDVFSDFLRPVLRDCTESVTYLAESDARESASRLSDVAFRTCLADRDGPVDLVARGLAALWFERDLTRLAGSLPRDLESGETALAAVARRRTERFDDRVDFGTEIGNALEHDRYAWGKGRLKPPTGNITGQPQPASDETRSARSYPISCAEDTNVNRHEAP